MNRGVLLETSHHPEPILGRGAARGVWEDIFAVLAGAEDVPDTATRFDRNITNFIAVIALAAAVNWSL